MYKYPSKFKNIYINVLPDFFLVYTQTRRTIESESEMPCGENNKTTSGLDFRITLAHSRHVS